MKFHLDCGPVNGLVLIDQSYLGALDDELLYAMDILLDITGKTELICDFPGEKWSDVWQRETKSIREFCNSGKMILWLFNKGEERDCEFVCDGTITDCSKWLHAPSGNLLAVTADEFIQCIAYPDLEMEKIFELPVTKGWYAVSDSAPGLIRYCIGTPKSPSFENVQEAWKL